MPYRYRFNVVGRVIHRASGRYAARASARGFVKREAAKGHYVAGKGKKFIQFKLTPVKKAVILVIRVTVGTGISVENRSGKGLRLSFKWSKVVLRSDKDKAVEEGQKWIRAKFGETASRLNPKYLREWGLDDMTNFDGFNVEDDGLAIGKDLGKFVRSWFVNGVEHKE